MMCTPFTKQFPHKIIQGPHSGVFPELLGHRSQLVIQSEEPNTQAEVTLLGLPNLSINLRHLLPQMSFPTTNENQGLVGHLWDMTRTLWLS